MTNAEKFIEVFGMGVAQGKKKTDGYWFKEYQGEPTIPLSVIEKIHDAVDNADSDGFIINKNGHMLAVTLTKEHVHEIIYNAVKGVDK